jgi:hypothetical protein
MITDRVQRDIANWWPQAVLSAKSGKCSLADAEAILSKYEAGLIDSGTAALDLYNPPRKLPIKSASIALPDDWEPSPRGQQPGRLTDAAKGHRGHDNDASASQSASDPDDIEGIFVSAGYPSKRRSKDDGLTASERRRHAARDCGDLGPAHAGG